MPTTPLRSRTALCRHGLAMMCAALLIACGGGDTTVGPGGGPNPPTGAQPGDLTGIVRNQATNTPLAGATVTVGTQQVRTGADGRFTFTQLPAGATVIQSAARGFGPYQATVTIAGNTTHDVTMRTQDTFEFQAGAVALYVPSQVDTVRAILLIAGGPDGRAFANTARSFDLEGAVPPDLEPALGSLRLEYQALARERRLAIFGLQRGRSADLLETVLDEAATVLARPELRDAPVLVHGMSAGTLPIVLLAARLPSRVLGMLLRVPPATSIGALQEQVGTVPTLIITAERDDVVDNGAAVAAFRSYRANGGLWALAEERGAGHVQLSMRTQQLYLSWVRTILDLRLPTTSGGPLRALREEDGWLGDLATRNVSAWSTYVGDRRGASWLPTQPSAEAWRTLGQ